MTRTLHARLSTPHSPFPLLLPLQEQGVAVVDWSRRTCTSRPPLTTSGSWSAPCCNRWRCSPSSPPPPSASTRSIAYALSVGWLRFVALESDGLDPNGSSARRSCVGVASAWRDAARTKDPYSIDAVQARKLKEEVPFGSRRSIWTRGKRSGFGEVAAAAAEMSSIGALPMGHRALPRRPTRRSLCSRRRPLRPASTPPDPMPPPPPHRRRPTKTSSS